MCHLLTQKLANYNFFNIVFTFTIVKEHIVTISGRLLNILHSDVSLCHSPTGNVNFSVGTWGKSFTMYDFFSSSARFVSLSSSSQKYLQGQHQHTHMYMELHVQVITVNTPQKPSV